MSFDSLREIFFQLQDSCLADRKILLDKTQFCRTVLYVIKNVIIFARHLSDKIKYFVSQNEILLVLTDRPALFVKTDLKGKTCMDSILIILKKKKKWPKGFICPYTGTIFYNIRIYSRSQVSVYRTIGPLVFFLFSRFVHKVIFTFSFNRWFL